MLSKALIGAMNEEFYYKLDKLAEHDAWLQKAKEELLTLIGSTGSPSRVKETELEDSVLQVIVTASRLGYYIGLKNGAGIVQSLRAANLPELLLKTQGELIE